MLQTIHDKITGWVAGIVIGAIGITFVFWGVETGFGTPSYAAKVKGHEQPWWELSKKISSQEVSRAYQERLAQYQQAMRGDVPAQVLTELQQGLMEAFVRRELLEQHANQLGYRVRKEDIDRAIEQDPAFQLDGQFNEDVAKRALANAGISSKGFREDQRRQLQIAELQAAIAASSFVTPAEIERARALQLQEREVAWAVIDPGTLEAGITPDEKMIAGHYAAHPAAFMTPDTVTLKYVEIKVGDLAQTITVNDEVLRAEYEALKERYVEPERRRARHILVNVAQGADEAAARKKADDLLAKAKAPGADFSALAKQSSEDAGSAQQGGDLGWAERSFFVGPFADALFTMQLNEIRGPVRSEFGYHIIRLDGIDPGKQKPFEEVREELANEYRTREAEKAFGERQEKLAESAFEAIDNLDNAAKQAGVPVQTVAEFRRQGGGGPFGANPQIIEAAFSDNVLAGQNSEPIELAPGHVVVVRAEDRKVPKLRPLAEVRDEVVRRVKREQAVALAKARGEEALAKLQAGTSWSAVVAELKVPAQGPKFVGRDNDELPGGLRQPVFVATKPAGEKPVYQGVTMPDGEYGLFVLTGVRTRAGAETPEQREARVQQLAGSVAQAEVGSYIEELRRKAEVETNLKVFE